MRCFGPQFSIGSRSLPGTSGTTTPSVQVTPSIPVTPSVQVTPLIPVTPSVQVTPSIPVTPSVQILPSVQISSPVLNPFLKSSIMSGSDHQQTSTFHGTPSPQFAFCGTFSGKDNTSAAKWIKRLEFELTPYQDENGVIPARKFLSSIDLLLSDEAAEWAEIDPDAIKLLTNPDPTAQMVSTFKDLFQQRFPSKFAALPTKSLNQQLSELHQRADETIDAYYKRTCALMLRVGARDRLGEEKLSLLEVSTLDSILKAFIKGLADDNIRRDTIRGLGARVDRFKEFVI